MLGTTLSHYEIVEKLGEGGMGVVYKALDTRLKRFVALKVLPPSETSDPTRQARLLREARAASALNHPHIVILHDIGEQDDVHFIVMEYVEGRALNQLIPKDGLPVREALEYAAQIAEAVAAAHAAGIVHRDLKPGNVVVTPGGRIKVLDFGLAKQTLTDEMDPTSFDHESAATRSRQLTQTGLVLGTLIYMSPEQAIGDPADHRSDIFSFGVLLYQMLTGEMPFRAKNAAAYIHELHYGKPHPMQDAAQAIPHEVEELVSATLEKLPADRPRTMEEVARRLRELAHLPGVIKTAVVAEARQAVGGGSARFGRVLPSDVRGPARVSALDATSDRGLGKRRRRTAGLGPPKPGSERASIAVLPFTSLSSDADDAFMAAGIASEIISALSGVPDLRVASRLASFPFYGPAPDLKKIARTLHIRYVLTGSLRRAGERIRVIAELTDALPGTQLWTKTYERKVGDVFGVQEEIARAIVGATGGQLIRADTERASLHSAESLDALGLVQKAYHFWNHGFTREGVDAALVLLRQAVLKDPALGVAHAALGMYLIQRVIYPCAEHRDRERAEALAAVAKAVDLAPRDPTVLGYAGVVWHDTGNHEKALAALRLCVQVAPFDLVGWGYLALVLGQAGEPRQVEEAQVILDRLLAEAPDHPSLPYWLYFKSTACLREDRHAEAAEHARRSVELNPGFTLARAALANALGSLGRPEEARAAWKATVAVNPDFTPAFYESLAREVLVREEWAEKLLAGLRLALIL
jgi:TolB-like protein/tetratricopeptide (TPR) repeat protein/predicted Ser/Thr protein kinase